MKKTITTLALTMALLQGCTEDVVDLSCAREDILLDGRFQNLISAWIQSGGRVDSWNQLDPKVPGWEYGGVDDPDSKYARLLGVNGINVLNPHYIQQTVTIPTSTSNLYLTGFRRFQSEEGVSGDQLIIGFLEASSSDNIVMNSPIDTGGWIEFTEPFNNTYAGMTVTLRIQAISDAAVISTFDFENLSLIAESCS
ncbi:MAG: hypothetical protein OEZ68_16465 [Gammaproteobacteria bacterium]|nr:hypothetical protein [Gammaproteobacteria bacterium]MDH5802396.1 hypothetical protein [Gammaproteobacteria bacterium]